MAELEIKYPKRVRFPSGEQKRFIELAKSRLNLTTDMGKSQLRKSTEKRNGRNGGK